MSLNDEQIARLRDYIGQLEEADHQQKAHIAILEAKIRDLENMVADMRLETLRRSP